MEAIGIICMIIVLVQPIILCVGMVKPQRVLPKSLKIRKQRLFIFTVTLSIFIIGAIIGGHFLPDVPHDNKLQTLEANEANITEEIVISDSVLAVVCKHTFDSLYNELMKIDQLDATYHSRRAVHKEIQKFLFEDWWNLMEHIDSTRQTLPLSRKEYEKSCKKYDKQDARFVLYGDEDTETIKLWAKSDAKRILSKLVVDPESLVIENVTCNGKTKKGWKCTVVYRAKNGFGGYVREYITLIMAYNMENSLYKCVDVL
jgi:hypothetical protein